MSACANSPTTATGQEEPTALLEPADVLACITGGLEYSDGDVLESEAEPSATIDLLLESFESNHAIFEFQPELLDLEPDVTVNSEGRRAVAIYSQPDSSPAIHLTLSLTGDVWHAQEMTNC